MGLLQECNAICVLMDQMNMPDQMLTSMLQALATKESSVSDHTSGNSVQVGG
jgi:hypothetical protein